MNFKSLQKKYDKEIKNKCDKYKIMLEECLQQNFIQHKLCQMEHYHFKSCVHHFNNQWLNKYKNYKFEIKY